MSEPFLPGVPEGLIRAALSRAGGHEITSGKFMSPESSAALAVNTFGWFLERHILALWTPIVEVLQRLDHPLHDKVVEYYNGARNLTKDARYATACAVVDRLWSI
jgi:hypothetical protein